MKVGDRVRPSAAALRERLLGPHDRGVIVPWSRGVQRDQIRVLTTELGIVKGRWVERTRRVVWAEKWWRKA